MQRCRAGRISMVEAEPPTTSELDSDDDSIPFKDPRTSDDELTPPELKTEPKAEIYQNGYEERILTELQGSDSLINEEPQEER